MTKRLKKVFLIIISIILLTPFLFADYTITVWVDTSHWEQVWVEGYWDCGTVPNSICEWVEGHLEDVWVESGYEDSYTIAGSNVVDPDNFPDLPPGTEITEIEEVPDELAQDEQNANNVYTSLDDFANQVEQDRNDAIDELNTGEEVGNAPPEKDPVRLATGDFYWTKLDIIYQYLNTNIKIQRSYQTQILSSHSFGKGWNFNYDTRIIHGVKTKAEEEVILLEQILNEVTQIYNTALSTYNTALHKIQDIFLPEVRRNKQIRPERITPMMQREELRQLSTGKRVGGKRGI